tara:strand:- start:203 stop:877 length:675 start_codon:yes stop_codon:yes gene_type:complete
MEVFEDKVMNRRFVFFFLSVIFASYLSLVGCKENNSEAKLIYNVNNCLSGNEVNKEIIFGDRTVSFIGINKECLYQKDKHGRAVMTELDGSLSLVFCPDADLFCDKSIMVYVNFDYLITEKMLKSMQKSVRQSPKIGDFDEMEMYRYSEDSVAFAPKGHGYYYIDCSEKKAGRLSACIMKGGYPDDNIKYTLFYWGDFDNYDWRKLDATVQDFVRRSVSLTYGK